MAPQKRSRIGTLLGIIGVLIVAGGGILWFLSSSASQDRQALDEALQDLEESISASDTAIADAKDALLALRDGVSSSPQATELNLITRTEQAIRQAELTQGEARELADTAREESSVDDRTLREIRNVTADLEDAAADLTEFSADLQAAADQATAVTSGGMDPSQIQQGDFSSIEGDWKGPEGQHLSISGSSIRWATEDGPFARIKELSFIPIQDSEISYEGGWSERWLPVSVLQWQGEPDGEGTGYSIGSLLAFYPENTPVLHPMSEEEIAPAEPYARILALPGNGVGRLLPSDMKAYLLTRPGEGGEIEAREDEQDDSGDECNTSVPGAYSCAGGPIPADARPIRTVGDYNIATLRTPSKNIGCDVTGEYVTCRVESWENSIDPQYNDVMGGYVTAVVDESGPASFGQASDAPSYTGANPGTPAGEILQYGTIAYHGKFVFASADTGLTYWNSETGHGALINRSGFYPFGPDR